ncbi:FHA domain protein (macronuclear) [Tetrahymena thermophila SB210]|uniref:FHA domain protein n=1 Tax=Tetrahymena thermophila (strain SB210) TaxID=312017 RepID=I7MJS6_TETTS|nr:FHA domain protein [Tetrahymena thermophila SB210]EAS07155.2 FHA domain protein [Tetrahymena thermophila SB210]|eukprot:XP_001027397.2 FHA domain protein [Tetrahymena thermophila SB210]
MSEIKSMSTREKIGTTTRRLIKYLYENRNQVFKLDKIFDDVQSFISDQKKLIDLVFILDGIGILTRISKKKFVFTGLKGMCNRINEYIKRKIQKASNQREVQMFCDEIQVNGKKISIKSSITQGQLFQDVLCNLTLQPNKLLQRSQFEQIMESYREIQSKSLTNDLNNILMTLCLGERNETTETIQYTGPEILNYKKITLDTLKNVNPNSLKTVILDSQKKDNIYFSYLIKEVDEKRGKKNTLQSGLFKELALEQGEIDKINRIVAQSMLSTNGSYFSQAATSQQAVNQAAQNQQKQEVQIEITNTKQETEQVQNNNDNDQTAENQSELNDKDIEENDKNMNQNEDTIDITDVPKAHISYFPKVAFALLKGRTWQFYIQKLQIIIGRSLINLPQKKMNWHIDLEVGASKKVSRQHAVILYNFEQKRFEIKCLSKKFHIKVDNNLYSIKDDPVPLKNKSLITVGNEHFYFFLPKNLTDEIQKKHEKILPDEMNAERGRREEDEDQTRNREEGDEEDDDEMEGDGEEDDRRYRQRRNMSMDGEEEDDEGESLSEIENKSTNRKKLKRNQDDYDNNEDYDYYQNREPNSEEDGNNDFLNEEEKEFLKKTNQNVNNNEEEEDDEQEIEDDDDDDDGDNDDDDEGDEEVDDEDEEVENEDEEEEEEMEQSEDE